MLYFLLWTLMLYWIHRAAHEIALIKTYHHNHHKVIAMNLKNATPNTWHWSNMFLFNDNLPSTLDLWMTEVIPTSLFCFVTGQWWIFVFYYLWAAFIQESIEHNANFDIPILTSGRWHLIHHTNSHKNFGLFFPIWDKLFDTYESINVH